MYDGSGARRCYQAAIQPACERGDAALDLGSLTRVDGGYVYSDRRRHGLNDSELPRAVGSGSITKNRHRIPQGAGARNPILGVC